MQRQMTEHEINVRNALVLRLASEDPAGVVGVLERSKSPVYVRVVNALAVFSAPYIEPDQPVEIMIEAFRSPLVNAQLTASVAETEGMTVALYDLHSLTFCTLRRRNLPYGKVESLRDDAEKMRSWLEEEGDDDPILTMLSGDWARLDDDEAVEVWLMPGREDPLNTGPAYRNLSDLIVAQPAVRRAREHST